MLRPPAIVRYEQIYIASFVCSIAASLFSWKLRAATLAANPSLAPVTWMLPATFVASIVVGVTLWYFTARSPSRPARWVVLIFAILSAVGIATNLWSLFVGRAPLLNVALSLLSSGLYIAATAMLFRPDAYDWFGDEPAVEEEKAA